VVSIAITLLFIILLLFTLLSSRWTTKPILILVVLISSIVNYFMNTYHVVIDDTMIRNTLQTNLHESMDLLSVKQVLYFIFLGLLIFALTKLLLVKLVEDDATHKTLNKGLLIFIGLGIGIFSITLGIGGAILLTPILVGMLHYPIKKAISASLFFVVFSSIAGLISRLDNGTIDFTNGMIVATASLLGVAFGIWLKEHINSKNHKNALVMLYLFALILIVKKILFT